MAYNAPPPVTTGQLATASDYNTYVKDNIIALKAGAATNGVHELFIPAAALRPHASGGCGVLEDLLLSSGRYVQGMPFDPTSIESASMTIALPKSWNEGTVTAQPLHMNTAGGSGAVVWQFAMVLSRDDDTLDVAVGSFVTSTDTILAAEDLMVGPATTAIAIAGTLAASGLIRIVVQRDPTAGGDTYASDDYLLGFVLRLTTDAPTDD